MGFFALSNGGDRIKQIRKERKADCPLVDFGQKAFKRRLQVFKMTLKYSHRRDQVVVIVLNASQIEYELPDGGGVIRCGKTKPQTHTLSSQSIRTDGSLAQQISATGRLLYALSGLV